MASSGLIYHLFCTVTGKAYVGQTWGTLEERWGDHLCKRPGCLHLQAALRKYGPVRFVRSILISGLTTPEQMDAAERYWIEYFDCRKNGYNIKEGGSYGKHSEETKKKIRKARKGQRPFLGHFHSAETKGAMSKSHLGIRLSEERKAKLLASHLGVKLSREECIQRSRARGGRPFYDQYGVKYETQGEAARILGLSPGNVCEVLRGSRKSARGYIFTYESQS